LKAKFEAFDEVLRCDLCKYCEIISDHNSFSQSSLNVHEEIVESLQCNGLCSSEDSRMFFVVVLLIWNSEEGETDKHRVSFSLLLFIVNTLSEYKLKDGNNE
jgi:hypothetical protein